MCFQNHKYLKDCQKYNEKRLEKWINDDEAIEE